MSKAQVQEVIDMLDLAAEGNLRVREVPEVRTALVALRDEPEEDE